ncbi:MAG: nucleotidyltransferase domain-containing protein [Chloroflexota bacterium]|nr:nucleotidyltransferase domain-containing protein [Chloroflexota bacterium]
MGVLQDVTARAQADPAVQGLILTGSHARGMATPHSDYDLVVVVAQRGGPVGADEQVTRARRDRVHR